MDYSPKLQRQSSCAWLPLDMADWFSAAGRRTTTGFSRRFSNGRSYDKLESSISYAPSATRPVALQRLRLRRLWRRALSSKKRILESSAPTKAAVTAPYDFNTYAQNFDDWWARVEPENMSRSFSSRFAVSSGVTGRIG
ncbi:hypothetical protein KSP40_PGU022680 [Platanthera guangdongensis]|uniref:Uncharacterized protein n=1 Tax=Platanthera guangdongensis TaxID=2320717 RepID=A0ABR2M1G1_9ASPA